jgi:hypothetical protein
MRMFIFFVGPEEQSKSRLLPRISGSCLPVNGADRETSSRAKRLIGIMWRRGPSMCLVSQNRFPSAT